MGIKNVFERFADLGKMIGGSMRINSVEDLVRAGLPLRVIHDIDKRITDWLASGGTLEDPYVKQQFRYAEKVVESLNKK